MANDTTQKPKPFNRLKVSVKRERPSWWTHEGVLEKLQAGIYIGVICEEAAAEMAEAGFEMSVSSLRAEVSKWTESATWGEQLRAALSLWKKTGKGGMVLSKDWHDEFFAAMEACGGNGSRAAGMAGVAYGIVLAVLDKRNKCYDAEFAEKYRIAELERVGTIRERYMETAEIGEGKTAARAQEKIIETALPALHGTRQEVHVTGEVEHQHVHGLAPGVARELAMASQARVRKLQAGRTNLLPADTREEEGRVIDVTPIAQRQRQNA